MHFQGEDDLRRLGFSIEKRANVWGVEDEQNPCQGYPDTFGGEESKRGTDYLLIVYMLTWCIKVQVTYVVYTY